MDVVAFNTQYQHGQVILGIPSEPTGPQWILNLLPYTYRAFPIKSGGTGLIYGAFPVLPQRSPAGPPIIQ